MNNIVESLNNDTAFNDCACVVRRNMKTRKCIYRFIISSHTHTHTHNTHIAIHESFKPVI